MDPPADGGGPAACASSGAELLAVPFEARSTGDAQGLAVGIHRIDPDSFLYVWAVYEDTLREDRITRLNPVEVHREPFRPGDRPLLQICTDVDVAAPRDVDVERRSFAVAAVFDATSGLPEGSIRFVVNWVAGCPCDPLPSGNATALFE